MHALFTKAALQACHGTSTFALSRVLGCGCYLLSYLIVSDRQPRSVYADAVRVLQLVLGREDLSKISRGITLYHSLGWTRILL